MTKLSACTTCEAAEFLAAREAKRDQRWLPPATHIATSPPGPSRFYLCPMHAQLALIAGWMPAKLDAAGLRALQEDGDG